MVQAPMPSLPIPRGQAGPGLLAHVAIAKYCDHLPLYRQAEIYARDGVALDRAVLAAWIRKIAWLVKPLADRIGEHVMAGSVIHADDTPISVLAPGHGKTRTGRLWVYLRDERPHADRRRPPCSTATRPTARASIAELISLPSAATCMPTATPGSSSSTAATRACRRLSPRSPVGAMRGGTSSTCTTRTDHRSPNRLSTRSVPCSTSSGSLQARRPSNAAALARTTPNRDSMNCSSGSTSS
jgi:hypothetical protein